MKRSSQLLIGLIVVAAIVVVAYLALHKSTKSTTVSTTAPTGAVIQTKTNSTVGSYLADSKGNTLYTYAKDTAGVSNCSGSCLATWPAYLATGSTGSLPTHVTTIKRSDGSMQYAYDNLPLYTFISDSKAGDVTGDGSEDFHVAKPATSAATTPAPAPAQTTPAASPAPAQSTPAPSSSPTYNY